MRNVYTTLLSLSLVLLLGLNVAVAVTERAPADTGNSAAEWCDDHNGTLYQAQSILHGGLHCELPNGTTVHVSQKIITEGG